MHQDSGRHLLQIPGPTNIPERVLRAISRPPIDHRGPEFARLTLAIQEELKSVFQTTDPVVIFPSSGSGAWEAALVNTLSPGDSVLMFETGHFATAWRDIALRLGLTVEFVPGDWRHAVDLQMLEDRLTEDAGHTFKAVAVVHNESSTGVFSRIDLIRQVMDRVGHTALLLVDAISSLGAMDYRHDEWGVDVTIAASQKGLMIPPGLSFNAVSQRAREAAQTAHLPRSYWDWERHIILNQSGFFPYTPPTNLLFGLRESLTMLREEGLEAVFARHDRFAAATRCAVDAWGLELQCADPHAYSSSLTAIRVPEGSSADQLRKLILNRSNMSLGSGLGKVKDRVFRIGHLGDFNDLMLMGALSGVEMGLALVGIPHNKGGITAAMDFLIGQNESAYQAG